MARDEAYREAEDKIEDARRKGVTSLDLKNLGLTELPESLGELTQLQRLTLSYNQLDSLPKWLGDLVRLEFLDVIENRLTKLPEALAELPNLDTLWIGAASGNPLGHLPAFLRSMKQLRILGVGACGLDSLPNWLSELTELTALSLSYNQLTALPPGFIQLTKLRTLFLEGNQLTDLPASFGQLTGLMTLRLTGNPLNPDLQAAYEQGTDAVLQFLRERATEEVALHEAKLILVGEGGVGKSSLLGALRGDEWVEKRDTTHGVEIKPVRLPHPDSDVELTLNAWDFGGQDVYRPTHQLFFSAPALYLVV